MKIQFMPVALQIYSGFVDDSADYETHRKDRTWRSINAVSLAFILLLTVGSLELEQFKNFCFQNRLR